MEAVPILGAHKKLRILFVEQDVDEVSQMREALSAKFFELTAVTTLKELEDKLKEDDDFDVVLLDIGMFGWGARNALTRALDILASRVPLQPVVNWCGLAGTDRCPIGTISKANLRDDEVMSKMILANVVQMLQQTLQAVH